MTEAVAQFEPDAPVKTPMGNGRIVGLELDGTYFTRVSIMMWNGEFRPAYEWFRDDQLEKL